MLWIKYHNCLCLKKGLAGNLGDGIDVEFFGKHDWEAVIKLTIGFFKALPPVHLWVHQWVGKKMSRKKQIWMIFQVNFSLLNFFMLKWGMIYQNDNLSYGNLNRRQKHLIVASIEMTKSNQRCGIFYETWLRGGDKVDHKQETCKQKQK